MAFAHSSSKSSRSKRTKRRSSKRSIATKSKQPKKIQIQKKQHILASPFSTPLNQFRSYQTSIHVAQQGPIYPLSTKESTQIAGLDVIPNGRDVLESLYLHTIDLSQQYYKKSNAFIYKAVENLTTYRLGVLRQYPDEDLMVERIIGAGQIEQLIEQAEDELILLDHIQNIKIDDAVSNELAANRPPMFGDNPLVETQFFPLPQDVLNELSTGRFTVIPNHDTKPLSRKFIEHIGFGDLITPEEHAKYDQLLIITDEEKAQLQEKMKSYSFEKATKDDMESVMLVNKKEPLQNDYYEWFKTSYAAFPEKDIATINAMNAANDQVRKL